MSKKPDQMSETELLDEYDISEGVYYLSIRSLIETKLKEREWIKFPENQPALGDEYQVVWNLDDNEYPVVTCMTWVAESKMFIDSLNDCSESKNDVVLYYKELDKPPKNIPKNIWFERQIKQPISMDEFERNIYGQCRHGENLAMCDICNSHEPITTIPDSQGGNNAG